MQFARKLTWPMLGSVALLLAGCSDATILDQVLGDQVSGLGTNQTLVIEVVNQTSSDIQLDLLVDDQPLTITCTAVKQVCAQALSTCPKKVEAVQQRSLDSFGRFIGGRNFNGNADFIFTTDEFSCDSTIVYKFTEAAATAFAL